MQLHLDPRLLSLKWHHTVERSRHIPTWTEPLTLCYLAEQASQAQTAAEIGTYMGRSARVMLDAGVGHLWCVDKFEVFGTIDVTRHFMADKISAGVCELIQGDSERGGRMLSHMAGKLDFVFVDDGHATEDVKRDIRWFLPLVRPGGIICGHDFDVPHNDVALGVIASLKNFVIPVPRLWAYQKPV